jgi:hypothetical protein
VCTPLPSLHCTRCGPEDQCIFSDTCNGPNTNLFPNNITAPGCSSNNRDAPPACVAVLVCSCSSYRAFYLLHWTYRYLTEAWYQPRYIGEHALCTADCDGMLGALCGSVSKPCMYGILRWVLHDAPFCLRCGLVTAEWVAGAVQTLVYYDFVW